MSDKRVGKHFKEYRELAGLTQSQLAEKLGITENFVSSIECGKSFPGYDNMVSLLNELKISPNVLLADVLNYPVDQASSPVIERLKGLSQKEQIRIMEIVDFLVKQAERESQENEISEETLLPD